MITTYNLPYPADSLATAAAEKKKQPIGISRFVLSLLNNGLHENLNSYDKLRIRTFNILNVASVVIAVLNILLAVFDKSLPDVTEYLLYNSIPLLFCFALFFMVKYHKAKLAFVLAFTAFPLVMTAMNFVLDDRAVLYFQIVFMVFPFFFFDDLKSVVLLFLLALACFAAGVYYEIEEHSHAVHKPLRAYEITSFASAMALFFATLFFVKKKVSDFQQKISRQRRELEQKNTELEQQRHLLDEKNTTLNKIFSIVSHDLRTPVEGLRLVLDNYQHPEDIRNAVAGVFPELKAETAKMSAVFQNLITWAKLEMNANDFSMEEVSIKAVCDKVVHTLEGGAAQKGIQITAAIIPDDLSCTGDPHVLEIVLRNLVSNSVKFCVAGDTISIRASKTKTHFHLHVSDTGCGMTPETLEKVRAKTFYTTHGTAFEKGTGLGLMICSEMIGKCKGSLHIESEAGKGTTVLIEVPVGGR